MALNKRPVLDPRWIEHHSPIEDGFALAYIEILKPNNSSKVYNETTNTWTSSDTVLYKGWARIQPNRPFTTFDSSNDFVPASAKDVEPYVQRVANKFKRSQVVDSATGNVDMRFNQMAVDQDYFIPVRDAAAANPIDTLPGATNLSEIADIEYIQKKLLTALRVPKAV